MFGQTHAGGQPVPQGSSSPALEAQEPAPASESATNPPLDTAPQIAPQVDSGFEVDSGFQVDPGLQGEAAGATTGDSVSSGVMGAPLPGGNAGHEFMQQLQALGWVDTTAMVVLLVCFVVGLFKGLFWQVSRIAILVAAYLVAGRFGGRVGEWLARDLQRDSGSPDTMLYLAYVLVFLVVVVILSLLAMQFQKVLKQTGLTFFDRLGGGVFGVATGAGTVLFLLFFVNMFFRDTMLGSEVKASHSQRLSRRAIDWLGPRVPDELRGALHLTPLSTRVTNPNTPNQQPNRNGAIAPDTVDPSREDHSQPTGSTTPSSSGSSQRRDH